MVKKANTAKGSKMVWKPNIDICEAEDCDRDHNNWSGICYNHHIECECDDCMLEIYLYIK